MIADLLVALLALAVLIATAIWMESARRHRRATRLAEKKRRKAHLARQLREPGREADDLD